MSDVGAPRHANSFGALYKCDVLSEGHCMKVSPCSTSVGPEKGQVWPVILESTVKQSASSEGTLFEHWS